MKSWLVCLFLALLTLALHHERERVRVWLLSTASDLSPAWVQEEAAKQAFRGRASAQPTTDVQQRLQLQQLIRQHRLADTSFRADVSNQTTQEFQAWRRQWEKDEERSQRLAWQRMTEAEMEIRLREDLLDQAWLEQQIRPQTEVSKTELEAAFSAQREGLRLPAAFHAAHLFLSRHPAEKGDRSAEIEGLRRRLQSGESWAALVQKHSEDARTRSQAGDLGWVSETRMPAALIQAAKTLKHGENSAPISTPLGWHLIKVLERQPARSPALADVAPELSVSIIQAKRQIALDQLLQRLLSHRNPGPAL